MWKENEFNSKHDDDSAIGDSPNNSAGEESVNSRRKSSTSDDLDEEQGLAFHNLNQKVGVKVPSCLLRNADECLESCKGYNRSVQNKATKTKRVIKVLPASTVLVAKTHSKLSENKKRDYENTQAREVLQAKLQFLVFEMKQLRELDTDILRKFVRLNECIDDMRWQLEQRETDLKRSMEQEEVIESIQDNVMETGNHSYPWEEDLKRLSDNEEEDADLGNEEEDMKFVAPVTKATTSYATLTSVKNNTGPGISNRSFTNPTYGHVDAKGTLTDKEKLCETEKQTFYRTKPLRPTSARTENPVTSSDETQRTNRFVHRPSSASTSVGKYVTRAQSFQSSGHNSAFRPIRDTRNNPSSNQSSSSQEGSSNGGRVLVRRVSDFQKQRDYQNLIDLSRVRGGNPPPSLHPQRQQKTVKVSDNRTSVSSIASSASSGSSASSMRSPTRPLVGHANHHKWARFGLGKKDMTKATEPQTPAPPQMRKVTLTRRGADVMIPRDQNVITVSYKRKTANDSVYSWIQSQDDVTYL